MLRTFAIIFSLIATPALAVELHNATNAQLLDELASRLNNGDGGAATFAATVSCDHADLEVTIFDEDFNQVAKLDEYFQSPANCQSMISALPFGRNGRVKAGQQIAYCDHADLEIYGVKPDGTLRKVSDNYQGSTQKCQEMMRERNARRGGGRR